MTEQMFCHKPDLQVEAFRRHRNHTVRVFDWAAETMPTHTELLNRLKSEVWYPAHEELGGSRYYDRISGFSDGLMEAHKRLLKWEAVGEVRPRPGRFVYKADPTRIFS